MIEAEAGASLALVEAAPAKINLALHVTGRRADGYHLIDTAVVFTAFGDRITVEAAAADALALSGPFAALIPAGADNLVLRARDFLRGLSPAPFPPVRIALEKNLPAASGIGGGSSDAAAALRALARHWNLDIPDARLRSAALSLGADLPMCLAARPLRASGIGEVLNPLHRMPALDMVLVNPGIVVATPAVFAALERRDGAPLPEMPADVTFPSLRDWLSSTRNDLETPARSIAPIIGDVLAALQQAGAAFARMSGSGATCFGLFEDQASAARAATAISTARPGWFVTATATMPSP